MNLKPKRQKPGILAVKAQARLKTGGQVAIEATVAVIAIFIFLLGVTQIFVWFNRNTIRRQKAYQETRLLLGANEAVNFYDAHSEENRLYVFPQEGE